MSLVWGANLEQWVRNMARRRCFTYNVPSRMWEDIEQDAVIEVLMLFKNPTDIVEKIHVATAVMKACNKARNAENWGFSVLSHTLIEDLFKSPEQELIFNEGVRLVAKYEPVHFNISYALAEGFCIEELSTYCGYEASQLMVKYEIGVVRARALTEAHLGWDWE